MWTFVLMMGTLLAAERYTISTVTGAWSTLDGFSGDGGPATRARLKEPYGLAWGPGGELYIADTWNHRVRAVSGAGIIRTVAGGGPATGDGGLATGAKLSFPEGIAFDSRGNLYITESQPHRIRRIDRNGIITTFAGTGLRTGPRGDGGPALQATIPAPQAIAIDKDDTVYFTDLSECTVRKITSDGVIRTIAGVPAKPLGDPTRMFYQPRGLAVDRHGAVYVADRQRGHVVKIGPDGTLSPFAGKPNLMGSAEDSGDGGRAIDAILPGPWTVAFDGNGDLLISDLRVRRVGSDGRIRPVLGAPIGAPLSEDLDPLRLTLFSPSAVLADSRGNLFVTDSKRDRVLRLTTDGKLTVVAGVSAPPPESEGGAAELARLGNPWGVAVSPAGELIVADTRNNRVIRLASDGTWHKVAGKGIPIIRDHGLSAPPQFSGDGGPATAADLDHPHGVAADRDGNIYIADSTNNRIRKVSKDGLIQTVAGTGAAGDSGDGGPATAAKLSHPAGLAIDSKNNLYVADAQNRRIRKITPQGIISTVPGLGSLQITYGVAVDRKDALYVADTFGNRLLKVSPDGVVQVIAGNGQQKFSGDGGPAIQATLGVPDGVAVDEEGNIYIADRANWCVRKISTDGLIHTIAGNRDTGYSGDGGPALKAPVFPTSIAVDAKGRVYITDNNRVRMLTPE